MKSLLIILMSSVLVNNYVLNKFLGICPFLGVSKKLDQAAGMGTAVTFVMLVATAVTWPIQTFVLNRFDLGYLQTIVFILVIATLVQFVEIILKKYIPNCIFCGSNKNLVNYNEKLVCEKCIEKLGKQIDK